MQFLQNLWPQVVMTGSRSQLRHTGHSYRDSGWLLSTVSFKAVIPIGWKSNFKEFSMKISSGL